MAVEAVCGVAESVVNRRPEVLMDQDAASAFVTDFAFLLRLASGMAGVAMALLEIPRMRVRVVVENIAAVARLALYAVHGGTIVARVAVRVGEAWIMRAWVIL